MTNSENATSTKKKVASKISTKSFFALLKGDFIGSPWFVNNMLLLAIIALLLLVSVAKSYYVKGLQSSIINKQADLDAKTAEYIENKAALEERTARFKLSGALEKYGLKESVNPVKVIRLKKKNEDEK